ncbi:MAG: transglutaminase domain-containing protein [Azoarcus sp.]|nr:transglutaminase domain-containing protein [Azoarcus sp.]
MRARAQLSLQSYPETVVGLEESPDVLATATRLPEASNPRTRALVAELVADARDASQSLERVLAWFSTNALTYTLAPPLLEDDPVDEFLFDARRGFCEHFSSAFVFMMRTAGVPARVVTGYQGGSVNRVDGTLVVRQSDAHAWAETWLPERGWVRVDPTALSVPSRIESGVSAALPAGETRPMMMRDGATAEALRALRDRWEALGNAWNRNVVGYDRKRQSDFMQQLGFKRPDWRTLGVALAAGLTILMLALLAWAMHQRRSGDSLDRLWHRFDARLARRGLARLPAEGPIDYAERVARALPDRAAEVRLIARSYARLRYGPPSANATALTRELAQRIREFSPQ